MLHPAQKWLRFFLLPVLAAVVLYQWYLSSQVIDNFAADGLIVKVRSQASKPMLEVYDKSGVLKRLVDEKLVIDPKYMKPGASFYKTPGSSEALINNQIVDLKRR